MNNNEEIKEMKDKIKELEILVFQLKKEIYELSSLLKAARISAHMKRGR